VSKRVQILRASVAALCLCAGCLPAFAQAAGSKVPDFSGFWERKDEIGGRFFNGTMANIPKASVKPEIEEEARRVAAAQASGDVVSFTSKWCLTQQFPFFMQHSAAWDLAQSKDEIVLAPEVHTFAKHIYLDGRSHPDPQHLVHSANGHSIGHWEGETLVVDTVGFLGGRNTPGGGKVGSDTHLTERFKLVEGGKILSVTSTWEDPAIYLKPHTYEMTYHRSDPGTYAFEEYCHADDPAQAGYQK
jgi:hypothetical protein